MVHSANRIRKAAIRAVDGDIGTVEDFVFQEDHWAVRYLVVDTGGWLSGRRVLISPMSVKGPWSMASVPVALTKEQVQNSPQIDLERVLSRDMEGEMLAYYGYPGYWNASGIWGPFDSPAALAAAARAGTMSAPGSPVGLATEASPLRSTKEIAGYHLNAADGEIGHVDDFLIGQESWRIRYLVIDTSNWIGGKSVVVSTDAVRRIDLTEGLLHVGLTRDQIKESRSFESIEGAIGAGETGPPFVII